MFDAHLEAASLTPTDIDNLLAFGVRGALCPPDTRSPVETVDQLVGRLSLHLCTVIPRLRAQGFDARAVLGIAPELEPQTSSDEALAWIDARCGEGLVRAIGVLGIDDGTPWRLRLLTRQLELAARHRLPALVRWPHEADRHQVDALHAAIDGSGLPADRLWFTGVTEPQLLPLARAGYGCVLHAGPFGLTADSCARLLRLAPRAALRRIAVGTGNARGSRQPFALPAVVVALHHLGHPDGSRPWRALHDSALDRATATGVAPTAAPIAPRTASGC